MTIDQPATRGDILLAGASGNLGGRIAKALTARGAAFRTVGRAELSDPTALRAACTGATCVVSALSGLREVIVDAQSVLLRAAVEAGVPRFIPSDYCIDYTGLTPGSNRNLDLRREFKAELDRAPIAATSIFNGAFTDMLTGQAPIILFSRKRVLYWGDADQPMDFTSVNDTAAVTAATAIASMTPRFIRVAGDTRSARALAEVASRVTGERFKLFRAGGLSLLGAMIAVMRRVAPAKGELYPPWQGMQYLHNMASGRARLDPLDNARFPAVRWTSVEDVLTAHVHPGMPRG